ncbi:NAD-dependent epimerase/dehydratase family protein [Aquisediminimonas profunda]|uniref:NAD-dependent epimerase/dehydratase family protein n=1 Tax=Aquisediminimonas profunda TaxID=1550733 RepID=UPI001C624DC1|nr:NAD(P)-dependent oxidoreductase [Aquisediminimonas profunda]
MKVLVTGASGFLGNSVVRAAAAAGHQVIALVRPTANVGRLAWPEVVEVIKGDLRQKGAWRDHLDIDVVVHLAAAPSGDLATQFAGTVQATENLVDCLPLKALRRFVHISSFSVYDYSSRPRRRTIDETAALEPKPEARDAYTITKMLQERLVAERCEDAGLECIIIRPGAIYGPGKDWDYGTAVSFKSLDLLFGPFGAFRLTYVDNCADAIVKAIDADVGTARVFNIVDDDCPSLWKFHNACRRAGAHTGYVVPIPWVFVAALGRSVRLLNRLAFRNRAKLPELLEYRRQQARWRPLRYSNALARKVLGWTPSIGLAEGIARIVALKKDPAD